MREGRTRSKEAANLAEFKGAYLEDSYFLGLVAAGANLHFRCLFALTIDHTDYAPPLIGEQHCYREGSIVLERPTIVDWKPGRQTITQDVDGTFDLGSIELYQESSDGIRIKTEWFDVLIKAKGIHLELN